MVFLGFGGYNHQNPAWAFADAPLCRPSQVSGRIWCSVLGYLFAIFSRIPTVLLTPGYVIASSRTPLPLHTGGTQFLRMHRVLSHFRHAKA